MDRRGRLRVAPSASRRLRLVLNTSETLQTPPLTQRSLRKRRLLRIAASIVAFLALVTVGGAAAYLTFLNHTVTSNVKHEALLPTPAPGESAPTKPATAKDSQNFLVIGSDSRAVSASSGRSDVIVLVHINSDRSRVDLVHFPRDLYVSVPGQGKDKINAAFAYGGAPLLVRTLQGLVNVPIDHVAIIGFEGFKAMTDAVGGVDVFAEESSTAPTGNIVKGFNHLNGDQALAFVRERHQLSEGDISRGKRQQAFIKALMLKGLSKDVLLNPINLASFADAATKNLTVDDGFSMGDMRSEALQMRNLRGGDIYFTTAPFTGFGTSPIGGSIDILDTVKIQQLADALQHDDMASYTTAKSN
ncbi:MAG: LCP family protein [Phycicoccus sp.]|nr:LCP family protein [Phycicoccus sp.]